MPNLIPPATRPSQEYWDVGLKLGVSDNLDNSINEPTRMQIVRMTTVQLPYLHW